MEVLEKCALNSHLCNFFSYIEVSILMKAPVLKKATLSREALAIVFPAAALFYSGNVFWVY